MTIVAAALVVTWCANYQYQRELMKTCSGNTEKLHAAKTQKYCKIVRVLGVISTFGLPLLAFFRTTSYPKVHAYAVYWFFSLEAIALVLNVRECTFQHMWR